MLTAVLGYQTWRKVSAANALKVASVSKKASVTFARLTVLVFKSERTTEVWGQRSVGSEWVRLREYPIQGLSGTAGPKLRAGDRQVPEGIYGLKPRAEKSLSLELDFPNEFDRKMAVQDARTHLGGGAAILGDAALPGCVSIGDAALEDLNGLVEMIDPAKVCVILAPNDLRRRIPVRSPKFNQAWLTTLYAQIKRELLPFAG